MPPWMPDAAALLAGIVLLLAGGDVLVRGAVAIAARLGVSPLIVGLTVVAFGTSAPELALNVSAALNDNTDLSFGNIVGSNIANIGLILGISALVKPMAVHSALLRREIPMMIAASLALTAMALTPWGTGAGVIGRPEGLMLLAGFLLFSELMRRSATSADAEDAEPLPEPGRPAVAVALVLGGLAMLVAGGALSERGAVGVAQALGMSDTVIGLTVVAVATSLPELATSIMAARRGHIDIAVGNVVGSNIFNILLVMGATASIAPTALPDAGPRALGTMLLLAFLLIPMSRTSSGLISRAEGALLLAIYAGSLGYEVFVAG